MLRAPLIASLTLLALLTPGAMAEDPKSPADKLESALKSLSDLNNEVVSLKAKFERLEAAQRSWVETLEVRNKLDEILAETSRLREEVRLAEKRSSSSYQPMPRTPDARKSDDGYLPPTRVEAQRPVVATVRLINEFSLAQEVLVNGMSHVLMPGEDVRVPIRAGAFSIQVMGRDLAPRTQNVPAGFVHTLRLY